MRRLLFTLLMTLAVMFSVSATVMRADDELTPPPIVERRRPLLIDQYPGSSLQFHSDDDVLLTGYRIVNNISGALFSLEASITSLSLRLVDFAWNLDPSRYLADWINNVNSALTFRIWEVLGGLGFTAVGIWIAVEFAKGRLSAIQGGLFGLAVALVLALLSQNGTAEFLGDANAAATELSSSLLALTDTRTGVDDTYGIVQDNLYKTLVLEPWAKANFSDLDTATKDEYGSRDLPGSKLLPLNEEEALDWFKEKGDDDNPDLSPWYTAAGVSKRVFIVLTTLLTVFVYLPVLFITAVLVLGAKVWSLFLFMLFPAALFFAAMPFLGGSRFLKMYVVAMLGGPITQVLSGLMLGVYLIVLWGLIQAAPTIPGGFLTVTLLLLCFAVFVFKVGRFFFRGLFTRHQETRIQRRQSQVSEGYQAQQSHRWHEQSNLRTARMQEIRATRVQAGSTMPTEGITLPANASGRGTRYRVADHADLRARLSERASVDYRASQRRHAAHRYRITADAVNEETVIRTKGNGSKSGSPMKALFKLQSSMRQPKLVQQATGGLQTQPSPQQLANQAVGGHVKMPAGPMPAALPSGASAGSLASGSVGSELTSLLRELRPWVRQASRSSSGSRSGGRHRR